MSRTSKALGGFSKFTETKSASALIVGSVMIAYLTGSPAIAEEKKQLSEVTVTDTRDSEGYNNESSSLSKLGNLKDTPKTITSVSRKLMDDQGVISLRDALRNVTGISIGAGEGGVQGDNFSIRGFSARGDMFIDGIRDFGSYSRDPFNLESVEVIKGPSSVILGRGSTGGIINQQTKEAHLGNTNKSSVLVGTNETLRFTTDINTQLSKTSAFRINLMANKNQVEERNNIEGQRFGIAPSLAFGLGTDTRFNLDYFHQQSDELPDYGVGFKNNWAAKVGRDTHYGFQDDFLRTHADVVTAKFEHDLNPNLTVSNNLRYGRYTRELAVGNPSHKTNGTVDRSLTNTDSVEDIITNQTNLSAKFDTFGVAHEAMAGVELSRETSSPKRYDYCNVTGPYDRTTNPCRVSATTLAPPPAGNVTYNFKTLSSDVRGTVRTIGVYVADTAHLTDKLDLLGSIRYENIKSNYTTYHAAATISPLATAGPRAAIANNDDVISWSAGVNYKLTDNGSIYASTGTSFEVAANNLSLSTGTAILAPEKAQTYEVGTKWDFLKKKLSTSFAVFRTDKENVREELPANSGIYFLSGRQVVNGFEAQASGNLTDKWKIFTGYAYLDGKVTETKGADKGANLTGTPRHSFNLFTTYKILNDVEIGGGANYVSERDASTSLSPNSAPAYTTYNAMAKYNFSKNLDFQLNVANLTNKYYYDQVSGGRAVPGEGRVFMLTTNFSF